MTEVKAFARFIPGSAKKARLVIDQFRNQDALRALDLLRFQSKGAVLPITKLLKSAVANAEHNFQLNTQDLYIKTITANDGPIMKRWMPKAHGRATVRKQTTHLELILGVDGSKEIRGQGRKKPRIKRRPNAGKGGSDSAARKKTERECFSGKSEELIINNDLNIVGHKVHPKIFRIGEIYTWDSKWFARKDFAKLLQQDILIKKYLRKELKDAAIAKMEIERSPSSMTVIIHAGKPGIIIGRGGQGVEDLKKKVKAEFLDKKVNLNINIQEVADPSQSAELIVQSMAADIEKRMPFRRVMKQSHRPGGKNRRQGR